VEKNQISPIVCGIVKIFEKEGKLKEVKENEGKQDLRKKKQPLGKKRLFLSLSC
jgi:hypothetical protein